MLEVRTTALEQHRKRKLWPAGKLLAATVRDPWGEVGQPDHDRPHLRQRGVQGLPDIDAVLNQVLERLRPPVMDMWARATRPGWLG